MRNINCSISGNVQAGIHRVITVDDLSSVWTNELNLAVIANSEEDRSLVGELLSEGVTNIGWICSSEVKAGDVLKAVPGHSRSVVLYREEDEHHSILLTNRCNSYCIMCSQPPTEHPDAWLIDEALATVRHIGKAPKSIGISGGEPLLAVEGLRQVIHLTNRCHPSTRIEVLTNGRLFSDPRVVSGLFDGLATSPVWLIPLYGHADYLHDFVVQRPGAFQETISGLLALQRRQQCIQLRIVLIEPVLSQLVELCEFISRNFPFVMEVALMACEPIGYALANRVHCEVDLAKWSTVLIESTTIFRRCGIPFLLMNAPLCSIPHSLWRHAHRSISDWKCVYIDECETCAVKSLCSGLFAWHESGWMPAKITAVKGY